MWSDSVPKENNTLYMNSRILAILIAMVAVGMVDTNANSVTSLGLLPAPVSVEMRVGCYTYNPHARVVCEESIADYVGEYLAGGYSAPEILLRLNPSLGLPREGYVLEVGEWGVLLQGVDRAGLLNGFHTLLQLFPPEVYRGGFSTPCEIPCVRITDYPAYNYRGQHLDVARTFIPIEEVREFISHLAHHKINHLHLHLTDDEGWRVEILSHPELTEVGAWRGGDSPIKAVYGSFEERYGGYYTQEQLRDLVKFAQRRGVEIVPEVDLPGHSLTIGKIHPEILCPVERDLSATGGYSVQNVWCVAREENYRLLEDILGEICEIFPSEYIHIGGDEVATSYWRDCPHCSALYKKEGMASYAQLEQHFMNRLVEILSRNGKSAAMWNEAILGGDLSRDVRIHCWEGFAESKDVAEAGYPTVVMPGPSFYFDMRQSKDEDGHNWAGVVTLNKCYSTNLTDMGFSPRAKDNVVGFSGAFWSELLLPHSERYESYLEYQTFPRICALSEVCWMPEEARSWENFSARLERHTTRLEAMGISYRKGAPVKKKGRQITPALKVTTSLPMSNEGALAKLSAYANDWGYRTTRTCLDGDWILYEFDKPISGVTVELTTGYRHVTRGVFPSGVVEISRDGERFEEVARLHNGSAEITLTRPTRAIRLRSTTTANGDRYVFVQYPIIRRLE